MVKAGFSKVDITPEESALLTGYGGNDRFSESCSQRIYARCAAFEDERGLAAAIVALDLCGLGIESVRRVESAAKASHGLSAARLVLNSSHNHSAPAMDGALNLYHERTPELVATLQAYTERVERACAQAISHALAALEPATARFEQGLCGFAVNRRRSRLNCRHLPGPVDHDVPVLAVKSDDGTRNLGLLFGYACHTTSLCGKDLNGDYSGWACSQIEEKIQAPALFLAGCGGDINPLPRYTMERSRACGFLLAEAVLDVLEKPMRTVHGPLHASLAELSLPLQEPLPLEHWERIAQTVPDHIHGRAAKHQIEIIRAGLPQESAVPYRVRRWRFNGLTMFFLSGETVVDYSLKLKEMAGWETTWVVGYCDHLTPYIPSERVLGEGGYEGTDSMLEYGYPSPFRPGVEGIILGGARRLPWELSE